MAEEDSIALVEVAYGKPEMQVVVELPWSAGLTAREVVDRSCLLTELADLEAPALVLGIGGKRVAQTHVLKPGDRVEICRPLSQDPRDMRRAALSAGSVMGQAKT